MADNVIDRLGFRIVLLLLMLVGIGIGLPAAGPVLAQSQTVTAEGIAGIPGGDKGIARDNALKAAQRQAVEQAVGTMIASETAVENFQVLKDSIYSKSQGYIQKFNIVREGAQNDLYSVTISATVATGDIKNDLSALGLLMARVGKPRVLFMIAEQNIGQEIYVFWWSWWGKGGQSFTGQTVDMAVSETILKEEFLNKGFNVVDISVVTGKFEISNAYRMADLTDSGAREIGKKMGAEVIVKGKVLAKPGPRSAGSEVGSYLADITVSAIRVDNGQVLASARDSAPARHVSQHVGGNQAIENAAKKVADKLIEQITAKWSGEVSGGQLVQITIRGLSGMKDLVKVKDFLQTQVRGVQSVIQRSFEGGVAVLELDAKSSAQQIGDELAQKDFGALDLDVTSATANTLEVMATRKGSAVTTQTPKAMVALPPVAVPVPPPAPSAAPSPVVASPRVGGPGQEDRHWMQPDDYFIAEQPYRQGWMYVGLAKIKQQAGTKTKGEAQFFRLQDSKDLWTKYFWVTRAAGEADLQVGQLAICFEGNSHDNVYAAPVNKDEARTERWFIGKVTDNSDLYKGVPSR
jgi:hypothetical protein